MDREHGEPYRFSSRFWPMFRYKSMTISAENSQPTILSSIVLGISICQLIENHADISGPALVKVVAGCLHCGGVRRHLPVALHFGESGGNRTAHMAKREHVDFAAI